MILLQELMVLLQAHIHADHVPHHRHSNSNHLELHLERRAHLMGFALERFAFCSNHQIENLNSHLRHKGTQDA